MKKGNGKGKSFEDAVIERLDKHDRAFDGIRQSIAELTQQVMLLVGEARQTNLRLDRVIENTGAHWRDLDRRVSALEQRGNR
jgi:hypothetical protein